MVVDLEIDVVPSFGYGWSHADGRRLPEPRQFQLKISKVGIGHWTGLVTTRDHPFEGRLVVLTQRHRPWDGAVNVVVNNAEPSTSIYGFATVDPDLAVAR
ncbi:MAG: hypothetical protein AAGI89_02570 [Pseudomonadota bacterium]